ncbi:Ser/Thr phosphatase family protein [Necator americanus]|uniref:Ser/Thr phosphatase family protein n=1 Tax=Necator americanus TaxID=51031 RepID=W2SI19_NECAM|nr:Ser/Thr phosphatase family protein [Necator americanus]ETN68526.1 Ser/Thr phosphatase family protein [Necator americanus]
MEFLMEMPATYDACHSVEAGVEYEAGNRRRLISIIRMECLLTLCNFFIYCQLMAYYDENGLVKCDRRLLADFSGAEGGVRIALVSDVHTGASVYTQQIEMVVDTLYDLDVDVVALVGDLVDGPVEKIGDRVTPCEMFKNICIIGVNDIASEYSGIHGHHMNLSTAMENCTVRSSRVVLAHNPASVLEFSKNDLEKVDVVLSGGTDENAANVRDLDRQPS